jgi:hypothetical protein
MPQGAQSRPIWAYSLHADSIGGGWGRQRGDLANPAKSHRFSVQRIVSVGAWRGYLQNEGAELISPVESRDDGTDRALSKLYFQLIADSHIRRAPHDSLVLCTPREGIAAP